MSVHNEAARAAHGAHARCGCPLRAGLHARRTLPVCTAYSSKPARRRRCLTSIHSVPARRSCDLRPCAKSVSQGVEPEGGDQGAELHEHVVHLAATRSRSRGAGHCVKLLATLCERVRALVSLVAELLIGWAHAGRMATCA